MKTTLYIQNLKCGGCANTITKNISTLDAITDVSVNVEESCVSFVYITEEKLIEVKEKLAPVEIEVESQSMSAEEYRAMIELAKNATDDDCEMCGS